MSQSVTPWELPCRRGMLDVEIILLLACFIYQRIIEFEIAKIWFTIFNTDWKKL